MMQTASAGSPVPSEIFTSVALLAISLVVVLLLRYYIPLRTTPLYLVVPVFFALWLPACIVLLVPIDLASSAATDDEATRGIWLPPRVLLVSWRITYWLTFALTWFILPILAEYSDAGYREPKDKLMYSLRENAQYHAMVFGSGILGLIYVFISYGVTFISLKGLIMALAYCWGLVLAIYLMGHGLVAIPRSLLRNASVAGRLRRIQSRAPGLYEKLEDAEMNLEELEAQVAELGRRGKVGSARDFADWIEELLDMTGLPEASSSSHQPLPTAAAAGPSRTNLPTVITQKYMADLTRQLVRARHARGRYVSEWARLLQDAAETQAILDSAGSKRLEFGRAAPGAGLWDRLTVLTPYARYLLHARVLPYAHLASGVFLALASACIIWSEMIKVALPNLSVIRLSVVHHWTGDKGQVGFAGQVIAALWILYMWAAALTSIAEVKVWRGRALVRRNTAHESAFWYASQVARLSVPLSYNFMTFLSPEVYQRTTFYDFLGRLIKLTPLGKWFDYLFPVFVLAPVCATLFGLYGRVRRLFGFELDIVDDGDGDGDGGAGADAPGYGTGSWREGRDLIERELNGTSIRQRRAQLGGSGADGSDSGPGRSSGGRRAAPVLSIPGARRRQDPAGAAAAGGGPSRTPFATSPNLASASGSRGGGGGSSRALGVRRGGPEEEAEDDNFFSALGHRMKNTIDAIDTPRWLQEIGDGIKKPRWMGGDDDEGVGSGSSSSRRGGGGESGSDFRRWFGGGDGRIRL